MLSRRLPRLERGATIDAVAVGKVPCSGDAVGDHLSVFVVSVEKSMKPALDTESDATRKRRVLVMRVDAAPFAEKIAMEVQRRNGERS